MSSAAKQATTTTITGASGQNFKKPAIQTQEGESTISYVRLGKLKAGDTVVEGIYLGSSANSTYPEKLDFKFKTADGKDVVVNEGGNLKYRMEKIAAGTLVMIIYNGMQKITKGKRAGKEAHSVEVLVAD